ncbi:MAG: hypothetical protein WC722_05815 [Rhodospirillales bacterium]
MTSLKVSPDRVSIRAWVRGQATALELAQAEGRLATARIDLKDSFRAQLPDLDASARQEALEMFAEEIEAACADLRLAGVTVQQQVERKKNLGPGWMLLGFVGAIGLGFIAGLIGVASSGSLGTGFVVFLAVFFGFLWLVFK